LVPSPEPEPPRGPHPLDAVVREIGYQHTVLCQTCLPYRDPGADVRVWERENGLVSLRVEAGVARHPETGRWVEIGLPYGPKPRLLLAHLNAEAIRTRSPEIDVEETVSAFIKRMGLHRHGRNIATVKDQLGRLSTALIRLAVANEGRTHQVNTNIITEFELWFPKDERRRVLWPRTLQLSLDYFASLDGHAVPLNDGALRALSGSSMALDLYMWLAQRLHRVPEGKRQRVSWYALKAQFGFEYGRMDNFRAFFRSILMQVHRQYRGARIDLDERGMILAESPPPVMRRRVRKCQTIPGGQPPG
jgi:hypothetical protein